MSYSWQNTMQKVSLELDARVQASESRPGVVGYVAPFITMTSFLLYPQPNSQPFWRSHTTGRMDLHKSMTTKGLPVTLACSTLPTAASRAPSSAVASTIAYPSTAYTYFTY